MKISKEVIAMHYDGLCNDARAVKIPLSGHSCGVDTIIIGYYSYNVKRFFENFAASNGRV